MPVSYWLLLWLSTAFVLGWVQIIFTSARGQCFSGENLPKGCVCVCVNQRKAPPAGVWSMANDLVIIFYCPFRKSFIYKGELWTFPRWSRGGEEAIPKRTFSFPGRGHAGPRPGSVPDLQSRPGGTRLGWSAPGAPGRRGRRRKLRVGHARRPRLGAILPCQPSAREGWFILQTIERPQVRAAPGAAPGSLAPLSADAAPGGPPGVVGESPRALAESRFTLRPTWLWVTPHRNRGGAVHRGPSRRFCPPAHASV